MGSDSQPEIEIRKALPEDATAIADFNRAMALETEELVLEPAVVGAGVASLFQAPELGFYLVATRADEIVAGLMVTTEWSDWRNGIFWWIQSVYVVPAARRLGIYRRLYDEVKRLATEDSRVCGFRLYVEKDNARARTTYENLGMTETAYRLYEESVKRSS